MKVQPTIATVAEAAAFASEKTGYAFSESEFLEAAAGYGLKLSAGPPLGTRAELVKLDAAAPEGFHLLYDLGWTMARLSPFHIGQILAIGETETCSAAFEANEAESERAIFRSPVRVTREQVRVSHAALEQFLAKFDRDLRRNRATSAETPASVVPAPAGLKGRWWGSDDEIREMAQTEGKRLYDKWVKDGSCGKAAAATSNRKIAHAVAERINASEKIKGGHRSAPEERIRTGPLKGWKYSSTHGT